MAVKKCRTWWFVQRIDNLPRDWEKILEDLLIPGAYIVHDDNFYKFTVLSETNLPYLKRRTGIFEILNSFF